MEIVFADLPFDLVPGTVMAPRPATEALVDAAVARIGNAPLRVADVGTGSGAIAVSIARRAPKAVVWATDVSAAAVETARRNAFRHGVCDRVHVLRGDLLDPIPAPIDLIVANLPYLPDSLRRPEYDDEPAVAIYAPGDGLEHYRRLLEGAERLLEPDGAIVIQLHRDVLEADASQLEELRASLERFSLLAA